MTTPDGSRAHRDAIINLAGGLGGAIFVLIVGTLLNHYLAVYRDKKQHPIPDPELGRPAAAATVVVTTPNKSWLHSLRGLFYTGRKQHSGGLEGGIFLAARTPAPPVPPSRPYQPEPHASISIPPSTHPPPPKPPDLEQDSRSDITSFSPHHSYSDIPRYPATHAALKRIDALQHFPRISGNNNTNLALHDSAYEGRYTFSNVSGTTLNEFEDGTEARK